MTETIEEYTEQRKEYKYYKLVKKIIKIFSNKDKTILDVGSFGMDLMSEFTFKERVSVSLSGAINNDKVKGYNMDFFDFEPEKKFDIVTCLQVIEHVEDAKAFTQKLLKTGKIVVISLPYKWEKGLCSSHVQDPVDENKIFSWTNQKPLFSFYIKESDDIKGKRIICIYGEVGIFKFLKLKLLSLKYIKTKSFTNKLKKQKLGKKFHNRYVTTNREPFFDIAKRYVEKDSKILDIGCGDGGFAKYIDRPDTYMIDGNEDSINAIKSDFKNAICAKLPILPYEDNFFDLIHTSHVVEHLEPQELYDLLKEVDRCLKPEGHLVISAPLLWSKFYNDLSHIKPYNPQVFRIYLCSNTDTRRTRTVISDSYIQIDEIYRYNILPYEESEFIPKHKYLSRILFFINRFKYFIGIRKIEKSGYTIVLRKLDLT